MAERSTIRAVRPGTGRAWSSGGTREPSDVSKVMSTTASCGNGLKTEYRMTASFVVTPSGTYHRVDGAEAHGPDPVPYLPVTLRSTLMSGALVSTTADTNGDGWRSARWSSARDRPPTSSALTTG